MLARTPALWTNHNCSFVSQFISLCNNFFFQALKTDVLIKYVSFYFLSTLIISLHEVCLTGLLIHIEIIQVEL